MAWILLLVAGLFEIGWAIGLKYTEGFTRPWPSTLTIGAMVVSIVLLGIAMKTLPVGTSYAVWVGVGAVGTAILGIVLFRRAGQRRAPGEPGADRGRHRRPEARHAGLKRRSGDTGGVDHCTCRTMPSIWKQPVSVQILTDIHIDTAVARLGIEFLEVGDDFIHARVPVDTRTRQPYGILHGGVSVVLAETAGLLWRRLCRTRGPPIGGAGHQRQPPAQREQRLGHGHGAAGAHRAQHAGLADRAVQRAGAADLRVAADDGGAGAARTRLICCRQEPETQNAAEGRVCAERLAEWTGLEPATPGVTGPVF